MLLASLTVGIAVVLAVVGRGRLRADDRGEGVISAAIAVLIMALLGVAMWQVFSRIVDDAGTRAEDNVEEISDE